MTTSAETANAPAPRASVWEDFVDIYTSPAAVYERRRDGKFGLALLVVTVVLAVLMWVWMDAMEPAMARQMAASFDQMRQQGMTEDQLAAARSIGATFAKVFAVVGVPIAVLLTGLAVWLVGKFFGSVASIGVAMMIATYAQFPRIIKALVEIVQAMLMDPSGLTTMYSPTLSPARFMGSDTSTMLQALAGRFDVFIIWMTVLIGIGTYVAGRTSKRNAAMVAIVVWLIGGLAIIAFSRQSG